MSKICSICGANNSKYLTIHNKETKILCDVHAKLYPVVMDKPHFWEDK